MKILVTGGAGYIGSQMVKILLDRGHDVTVLDDLSTGHAWAVSDCELLQVNLLEENKLSRVFRGRKFDGVIHFAAKSLVSESVQKPDIYYRNNVVGTLNLIHSMLAHDVDKIVFSSTAAIFGNPTTPKISEEHAKHPVNPYGRSKLMIENMLEDMAFAYGLNAVCFRYFNAAGADASASIGEAHEPETHLIPNVLRSLLKGEADMKVFGVDYDTLDGTCVRDYIHVNDLADAHLLGFDLLKSTPGFHTYNLGNGNGFSVMDVIRACETVTGKKVRYTVEGRRQGDPAVLVADSTKARTHLNWVPEFVNLEQIIETAWRWHKNYHAR